MSNRFTKTALVSIGTLVFSLLLVSACCDKGSLRLRRISAFLSGVFEVAFELEIDGYASFDFDGDAGDWARIPAFDGARIATDLSAAAFSRQQAGYDVDWDAVDETIRLVLAENADPDIPDLLLIQWGGDAYTADKGVCYLGWTEQGQVKIAASHCDDDIGVMYCRMSGSTAGVAPIIVNRGPIVARPTSTSSSTTRSASMRLWVVSRLTSRLSPRPPRACVRQQTHRIAYGLPR